MNAFFRSFFSAFSSAKPKPRIYIDSSSFDPDQAPKNGQALLLFVRDQAETIYDRVLQERSCSAGVVVIDQGSTDGTPYLAAEAGAIVILQEPGRTQEEALREGMQVARRFADKVQVLAA